MQGTEIGKNQPGFVPPDGIALWRWRAMWLENAGPAGTRGLGTRLFQLLAATDAPLHRLAARGVSVHAALTLLCELDGPAAFAPKSSRRRHAEAASLDRAAQIVEAYRHQLQPRGRWVRFDPSGKPGEKIDLYPSGDELRRLAECVRAMRPGAGRPAARRVLVAARALEVLVTRAGGRLIAQEIAEVIKAAWPSQYRADTSDDTGPDDEARAARKLLWRAHRAISDAEITGTVPKIVPASTRKQAKTTQRQPRAKRKTR